MWATLPELDAQIVTVQNYVHKILGVAKSLHPKNIIAQTTIGKDFLSHDTMLGFQVLLLMRKEMLLQ